MRREQVVAATLELLAEGGVAAASTPAIARRIGMTQSGLFKHFAGKDEILRAVMEAIGVQVGEAVEAASASTRPPAERILAILGAYLRTVREIPAIPALLLAGETLGPASTSRLPVVIESRFKRLHAVVTDQLETGKTETAFDPSLDVDTAAHMAVGIAQGLILRWQLSGRTLDMGAELERLFPLYLRSIAREPGASG